MAGIASLLGDGSIKGKAVITVGDTSGMEYDFAVDGEGNLTGAYEYGYNYDRKARMAFSIRKDPSEEAEWLRIYVIDVLANLMGTDESLCSRTFVSDTELPAGGAYINPMPISEAIAEAGKEHDARKTQFIRLGLSGKSPDDIYVHTYRNDRSKDRNDYDRLFAKADEAFASLTGIIDLSPGFHLSEIYKHMADGLQSHELSIATSHMEQDYGNGPYDGSEPEAPAGGDGGDVLYNDFNDDNGELPFDKLDWNRIIHDNQEDISGEEDGEDRAETDDGNSGPGPQDEDSDGPVDDAEDDDGDDGKTAQAPGEAGSDADDDADADGGEGGEPADTEGTPSGEADVRDDVRNYLSDKLDKLKDELDRQNRIIDESDEAIKGIPDRSADLDRISKSLDEERSKLTSLEDELKSVQHEEADNEDRRGKLREAADKAVKSRDGIKADMDWIRGLLGD